jgi:Lysozyme like domain
VGDFDRSQRAKRRGVRWRLRALRLAHKRPDGRDYLRRLRRATRPAGPLPARPKSPYRRFPPRVQIPKRTVVILALALLLLVIAAVWADGGEGASKRQIKAQVCRVFGDRCGQALEVARCETGGTFDPHALGSAGERGLFQIHPIHFGWLNERRLFQPLYNAWAAYRLSHGGRSWSHWTCRP